MTKSNLRKIAENVGLSLLHIFRGGSQQFWDITYHMHRAQTISFHTIRYFYVLLINLN